ncbi:hypothetical protein [Methylocucumis oryzae]|uniref:Uncharacterized protein n=1 Tax=Methylocucumis oryzae TaxID=1632867 RepID=A0A0F3IQZ4_9GAMM|nr:hypothetical protein [Methylocucumis oryzae]KJV08029.1 hypothetical protein VZ94_01075 [Methylocucumis oryzae]
MPCLIHASAAMLNNVPDAINRIKRNVVINHPNTYNCHIVRKIINRADEPEVGGLPTLGGLGMISADDEQDVDWDFIDNGYALPAEPFGAPSQMMDRQDANNPSLEEFRFLIEPEDADIELKKNDVIYLIISEVVLIAFEIVTVETLTNIAPFNIRYVCNKRPDLFLDFD